MKQFTESHLKDWKEDYIKLLENKRYSLNKENVWMLGEKKGIICFFSDNEIAYICYAKSIYQTLKDILEVKKNNGLVKLIMTHDLDISTKKINQKSFTQSRINKIKKIVNTFEFTLLNLNSNNIENITNAFVVISDPIYNGHTSNLNRILDDLPQKKL